MIFENFWVKSYIRKIIEDNIFDCMAYRFYTSLLFDFEFDFQIKNCKFKLCLNCFETMSRLIYMSYFQKYYSLSFFVR